MIFIKHHVKQIQKIVLFGEITYLERFVLSSTTTNSLNSLKKGIFTYR